MRRNCRFHGEVICIKNGKYGSMYVPKEESAPKEGKKPSGDNALDGLREDIERIKDENIKRNRDNLDALYNIDMRNMSPSMKRLFSHYSSEIADARAEISAITSEDGAVAKMLASFKTEIDGEIKEAVSYVQATADSLQASVNIVAKYDDRLAAVEVSASENESKIALIVTDENKINTAQFTLALKDDESFAELVAGTINLTGYVTFDDIGAYGTAIVSGNRITMEMNGMIDDEYDEIESTSRLNFNYWLATGSGETSKTVGAVTMKADGEDTGTYSRYALLLETYELKTKRGNDYQPAIKLRSAGGTSIESMEDVYMEGAYITLASPYCTRIRAVSSFDTANDSYPVYSDYDYVFALDGIYFGTHKLLDNPYNQ